MSWTGKGGDVHAELLHLPLRPARPGQLRRARRAGSRRRRWRWAGAIGVARRWAPGPRRRFERGEAGGRSRAGAEAVVDPAADPIKDAARAWAGGTGVDWWWTPSVASRPSRLCGTRRSGPLSRHRVRVGRHPVGAPEPGPVAQPVRPRDRLGIWAMTYSAEQRARWTISSTWRRWACSTLSTRPSTRLTMWPRIPDLLGLRAVGNIPLVP